MTDRGTTGDLIGASEAARIAGVSVRTIQKAISDGDLTATKDGRGRYRIDREAFDYWREIRDRDRGPSERGVGDNNAGATKGVDVALVDELRDRLRFVEDQLQRERDAHAETRRIAAALTSRVPQLEPPREHPSDAPEARVTPSEGAGGGDVPREPHRGFWSRLFGN